MPITNFTNKRKPASLGTDRMVVKYVSRPTIYKTVTGISMYSTKTSYLSRH